MLDGGGGGSCAGHQTRDDVADLGIDVRAVFGQGRTAYPGTSARIREVMASVTLSRRPASPGMNGLMVPL
jgi:hypothetical protein